MSTSPGGRPAQAPDAVAPGRRTAQAPPGAEPLGGPAVPLRTAAATVLAVPGPRWSAVVVDAAAAAGVLSLASAVILSLTAVPAVSGAAVGLFALVLLGLTAARLARAPGPLQAVAAVVVLAAAWASVLDLYISWWWLDIVVHLVANGVLAVVALLLVVRSGLLVAANRPGAATVLLTVALGLSLGVLWELGEWAGHTLVDDRIGVGYDDTVGDLAAGGLGSAAAGLLAARARWLGGTA